MALVFLNGGAPNYTGFEFSTSVDLIDRIEMTLVSAGWVTDTKVSGVSLFIRARSIVGSHNAWIEFIVSGTSPNLTLTMRAWLQQARTNGSPNAVHTLTYTVGGTNRLWLTADDEAGCISIYNPTGNAMSGYHFGFLHRVDTGDQWAWMIGRIYASSAPYAYVARAQFDAGIWRQIGSTFSGGTADPQGNGSGESVSLTTFDYMMQGFFSGNGLNTATGTNAYYLAYQGALNYNSQAVIVPYYGYHEGRTTNSYGSAGVAAIGGSNSKYHRGFVKYAAHGTASLGAAQQAIDPVTGFRYLSVGGLQWQAMRIL